MLVRSFDIQESLIKFFSILGICSNMKTFSRDLGKNTEKMILFFFFSVFLVAHVTKPDSFN